MIAKNLENKEKSTASFDVVCDAAEFEAALNKAYLKNKKDIYVQGFRKGKAPRMVIEGMYGKDVFYEEATDILAPDAFKYGTEELGLHAVGTPSVTKVDISDAKELTLSYLTAVWPEVTLGEYKGIEAPRAKVEVTDAEIDEELEKLRRRNARFVDVDRPAKSGDTAVIDYEGSVNGVPFDGGKADNHELVLGSGSFIPGFEDQVIGMSAGEEADINVTFPEDYHEASLAGAAAVFHVKVNAVREQQLPELDDEFVKDVSDQDTLAEYRETLRARMTSARETDAEDDFHNELIKKAGDNITAEIPDAMVEEQVDNMLREYEQNLQANGLSLEMYLRYMGQTEADFRKTCRETAERRVRTDLLLTTIAEVEGIEVSDTEIEEEYQKVADDYYSDLETVKKAVPQSAVVGDIKSRKAAEIIFAAGIPTEPAAEPEETAAEEAPAEEAPAAE